MPGKPPTYTVPRDDGTGGAIFVAFVIIVSGALAVVLAVKEFSCC
jgi:hypothetical protein